LHGDWWVVNLVVEQECDKYFIGKMIEEWIRENNISCSCGWISYSFRSKADAIKMMLALG
jgi:hypothetical protein